MFNTVDPTFQFGANPASSFLQENYNQTMYGGFGSGGLMQNQFSNVMNSMQAGVTSNAQQGNIGANPGAQMTPQQIAAQMNTGGVMSVLPQLGNSFLPKLMFPIAGLWSLVSGVKAIGGFITGARSDRAASEKFDPAKLAYNQDLNEMYEVSQRWNSLGPFSMQGQAQPYGF
jgi:hypothetical protein